jgi:hypothetical protein
VLLGLSFESTAWALFPLLDARRHAQTVAAILGDRFETFYDSVSDSATRLAHFDTLVNLDLALNRSSAQSAWPEKFESLNDTWLDDTDLEEARTNHDFYARVAEHLELSDPYVLEGLEELAREAEEEERASDAADDSWRDDVREGGYAIPEPGLRSRFDEERASIDALFESLSRSESR